MTAIGLERWIQNALPVTPEAWQAYRSAFRALGPCHRIIDRWRYDLGWNCPEPVVVNFLAVERGRLVTYYGAA